MSCTACHASRITYLRPGPCVIVVLCQYGVAPLVLIRSSPLEVHSHAGNEALICNTVSVNSRVAADVCQIVLISDNLQGRFFLMILTAAFKYSPLSDLERS